MANNRGVSNNMQCKEYHILILENIYQEIDQEDKNKLESHLRECVACREEYEELKKTLGLMKRWKDETPEDQVKLLKRAKIIPFKPNFKRIARQFALAAAAILLFFSILNFNLSVTSERFDITFSLFGISNEEDNGYKFAREDPQLQVILRLIDAENKRQNAEIAVMLTDFYQAVEMKRQVDLKVISQGIESIRNTTDRRLNSTDEILHGLIQFTGALAQDGIAIKTKK
jgi:hypothetical protein